MSTKTSAAATAVLVALLGAGCVTNAPRGGGSDGDTRAQDLPYLDHSIAPGPDLQRNVLWCEYGSSSLPNFMRTRIGFWTLRSGGQQIGQDPQGRKNFVPLRMATCPRTLRVAQAVAVDAGMDLGYRPEPVAPISGPIKAAEFQRDLGAVQAGVNGFGSVRVATTQLLTRYGPALEQFIRENRTRLAAMAASKTPEEELQYANNGIEGPAEAMVRSILITRDRIRTVYPPSTNPVIDGAVRDLEKVRDDLGELRSAAAREILALQTRLAPPPVPQAERNATAFRESEATCQKTSTASNGRHPSEKEMCFAYVQTLKDAVTHAEAMKAAAGKLTVFDRFESERMNEMVRMMGHIGAAQGKILGNQRATLQSFRKAGECSTSPDRETVCPFQVETSYENPYFRMLMSMELAMNGGVLRYAFHREKNKWVMTATEAQRRLTRSLQESGDRITRDMERQNRQYWCARAATTAYGRSLCYNQE